MFLALKEMKKDKGRFLLIISIVVLISYLVFFLTGLAYGLAKDNTSAVEKWGADKVVLKSGTNANILSSMMDMDSVDDFNNEDISPINIGRSVAYLNGDETDKSTIDLVLIGLKQGSTAYPEVIEGDLPKTQDEVLASITLRDEDNVQIGDTLVLSMNDRKFKVTGFTQEAKFNVSPVIFTDLEMASASMMVFIPEQEGQVDDKPDPSTQPIDSVSSPTPGVPERISGILVHGENSVVSNDNYDVLSIDDFIQNLPGYLAQVLTFGWMIGFLILISTIVLGVFMYIITMQKKQTFGIMKVQGISNSYIAKSVIIQTFLVSLFGVLIGLALTYISEYFLPYTVPFKSNIAFYGIIGGLILLISLVGAIFSVKGVSKVDPLEVLD
ncbi:MAG: ABC transporter permease [Tissierellia bacterium]|nr:ABC transporter permease [Tissierellia bacterium]